MALPVNLEQLLTGQVVEWARLECKAGWNEEAALHTICAFANDLDNWGGGYLIIGVAEQDGRLGLPPAGLLPAQVDAIQKKLMELCNLLTPPYYPVVVPEEHQGRLVLVVWAPGGENRPYKAPASLSKEGRGQREHYVRHFASTTKANSDDQRRLLELTAKVPFDDRINHHASLGDLSLGLIRDHLHEIKSKLADEAVTMPFEAVCRQMRIVGGPPEYCKPLNIGLLMFNEQPEQFFPGAAIEVNVFRGTSGRNFEEQRFSGPLSQQIKQALRFLRTTVLREAVHKLADVAEAQRFFNYPYAALEEAVANAVYHKSYELRNPIEINVRPQQIEILSFPGALPPITAAQLRATRPIVARNYRNRRIGDFLKELHLTEGKATGLGTIRTAMANNGSPPPAFEMDEAGSYFLVILPIHAGFPEPQPSQFTRILPAGPAETPLTVRQLAILRFCQQPRSRKAVLAHVGLGASSANSTKYLTPLVAEGYLAFTIPDAPKSTRQEYIATAKSTALLGRP